ncbi:MAG: Uma2 family endonuclease [Isosphaeraceae bacterium]
MSHSTQTPSRSEMIYPDSDGLPMAENTLQFEWITTIKGGLDALFRDRPDVFVAGDLLWYPLEGDNTTRVAPDALVAFGRPKGYRGSYMQWVENGIPPQVVFEVLSPGNRAGEMRRKLLFYERFGVEEYYLYDPDAITLAGWRRAGDRLTTIPEMDGWISPRLGVRFELADDALHLFGPDGRPFLTYVELARERDDLTRERDDLTRERDDLTRERDEEQLRADHMAQERDEERLRANHMARERDEERLRTERLAEQLRSLGIEPAT